MGCSPAPRSASIAACSCAGATTTQKPVPMLKVAYMVAGRNRPAVAMSVKMASGGGSASQVVGHVGGPAWPG